MEYLFLLYSDPSKQMTQHESDQAKTRQWSILDDTAKQGILRGAGPLDPSARGAYVRSDAGCILTTDGPYAETKEALAGYYIIDCRDNEEAKYWAGRLSQTGCASVVEFNRLMPIPSRVEDSQPASLVNA
ncbi:MAG TPA: YciI family protein [Bryobacteraceae bacterium]|nr:YciI family protein [Bryobacteraceae bacterium]